MPTVADIAALLNVPVSGDASRNVTGIATLRECERGRFSFLGSDEYLDQFLTTRAAAVIVDCSVKLTGNGSSHGNAPAGPSLMIVDDSDLALIEALQLFATPIPAPPVGVDPAARVSPTAMLARRLPCRAFCLRWRAHEDRANTVLHAGAFVGDT